MRSTKRRRDSFLYLAPLWIIILAFAVPATLFMLWKATQKSKLTICVFIIRHSILAREYAPKRVQI